jgi:hypothetical protein
MSTLSRASRPSPNACTFCYEPQPIEVHIGSTYYDGKFLSRTDQLVVQNIPFQASQGEGACGFCDGTGLYLRRTPEKNKGWMIIRRLERSEIELIFDATRRTFEDVFDSGTNLVIGRL